MPPGTAVTYYFSDCQSGASAGCVQGNNANAGTSPSSPKQNLSGFNLGALPAGTQLLFARGGAWNLGQVGVNNRNTSAASPLVFADYGSGALPVLRVSSGVGFALGGGWGNADNDGGYTFRNLNLRGSGASGGNTHWAFWLVQNVRDVVIDGVVIEDFGFGIESNEGSQYGVRNVTVRNSTIRRNGSMGWHATGLIHGVLAENNVFEANNASGSFMNHAIYWGGGNGNVIRNNRFLRNSEVNGVCQGGNITMHGVIDGLLIENNTIEHANPGADTCGGYNITAGYSSAESFRNVVVRGNTTVNVGIGAVIANSAPGIVIEGNRSIQTAARGHTLAMTYGENEVAMTNPVVRNNVLCIVSGGSITNLPGAIVSGNSVRTGADSTTGVCAR